MRGAGATRSTWAVRRGRISRLVSLYTSLTIDLLSSLSARATGSSALWEIICFNEVTVEGDGAGLGYYGTEEAAQKSCCKNRRKQRDILAVLRVES
jgi:hypothetical protein